MFNYHAEGPRATRSLWVGDTRRGRTLARMPRGSMAQYTAAQPRTLHGPLDDFFAGLSSTKAGSQAQEYMADTLSKAGQKFVKTPEGKGTISKLSINVLIPALLIGFTAGYLLGRKKG